MKSGIDGVGRQHCGCGSMYTNNWQLASFSWLTFCPGPLSCSSSSLCRNSHPCKKGSLFSSANAKILQKSSSSHRFFIQEFLKYFINRCQGQSIEIFLFNFFVFARWKIFLCLLAGLLPRCQYFRIICHKISNSPRSTQLIGTFVSTDCHRRQKLTK